MTPVRLGRKDAHVEQDREDERDVHDKAGEHPSNDEKRRGQKQARSSDEKQKIHGMSGKDPQPHPHLSRTPHTCSM
jgi:hypothetical protein